MPSRQPSSPRPRERSPKHRQGLGRRLPWLDRFAGVFPWRRGSTSCVPFSRALELGLPWLHVSWTRAVVEGKKRLWKQRWITRWKSVWITLGISVGTTRPTATNRGGSCCTLTLSDLSNWNRSWTNAGFVSRETLVTSISSRQSREKHRRAVVG